MTNPIRSAVVALLLLCAVGAPLASAVVGGAFSKPARFVDRTPVAAPVARVQPSKVVWISETTITTSAPAKRHAAPVVAVQAAPTVVRTVTLDQGGRPGFQTVTAWGV